ncbi:hypothetical protein N7468_010334 [Penicillium chermesinum]|uniref:Uncharacterized protein n=1 Tax=Penicillium chermesinum TaxID=63820 RepID=A0A9W9TCC8_9EURO|nr:uncharacterized protein N7468_010334 [Penicillium chermesinum]KAJ5217326.1 hypothetical protein N7468_010334 [Penicillium chermesinum]
MRFLSGLVFSLLAAPLVDAVAPKKPGIPKPKLKHPLSEKDYGQATFQQLLDHKNPSLGTFSQRYWYSTENWNGPGSPVVLMTPGEVAMDGYEGYLTNRTLTGLFAQAIEGAVILIEHRYWGQSSPYIELTAETLQYLTLENSIADLTYFAKNVKLPFDESGSTNAQHAPWVLAGGSYSGALSAWTASTAPGTFWAYYATSAPVEAIYNYWQYFVPVQEGMPKNCSKDISRVVDYLDSVNASGDKQKLQKLYELFGLDDIDSFDDFAGALENGPWLWQENQFDTGYSEFYQFCDYIEGVRPGASKVPGAEGVGLKQALQGYVKWFRNVYLPNACTGYGFPENSTECLNTRNTSSILYTETSVNSTVVATNDRQWQWFLCNEPFFYWQDGAPSGVPSLVSRTVSADYYQRQCPLYFPTVNGHTYGSAKGKTAADVNKWTKGWDLTHTTRLTWTNGQFDPWRTSGVSSGFRPGGPLQSTPEAPVNIIPAGIHCSDLSAENGLVNAGVQKVIDTEVAQIKTWVAEYYKQ